MDEELPVIGIVEGETHSTLLNRLARYPFLPEAADYVGRLEITVQDIAESRAYAGARARARDRIFQAIQDSTKPSLPVQAVSSRGMRTPEGDLATDLLSYVYSRVLVSALGDGWLIRRHALAESLRVAEHLIIEEDVGDVIRVANELGMDFRALNAKDVGMHFTQFLHEAVGFKDETWKLVQQSLEGGYVRLDRDRAARLVQERLRNRIVGELPRKLSDEIRAAVARDVSHIATLLNEKKATLPVAGFGRVDLAFLPPCMKLILSQLQRGENAPHNARFAIVTFLHRIGMSSEEIMALFAQAPDFREDLTRYQVEHITGVSSGTTYSVPSCSNLKTFNLCAADDLCRTTTRAGKQRVAFPPDYYKLMHEAGKEVERILQVLPIVNERVLVAAAARQYGFLLRLRDIADNPLLARIDGQALAGLAQVHKFRVGVEEKDGKKAIVLSDEDPFALVDLLNEPWVESALRPARA